jgi:hypothetical protein
MIFFVVLSVYLIVGIVFVVLFIIDQHKLSKEWRQDLSFQIGNCLFILFLWIIIIDDLLNDFFLRNHEKERK